MAKAQEIISLMGEIAPVRLAEEWDNVGLQIGDINNEVGKILLALDLNNKVIDEAIENNCNMIITHHPVIFNGINSVSSESVVGQMIIRLIKNDIIVFSAHTNLDIAQEGLNDYICNKLGIKNFHPLEVTKSENYYKFVVFVPKNYIDEIKSAVYENGGGKMGKYSHSGFYLQGKSSFKPLEGSSPHIGSTGKISEVDEIKLETVVAEDKIDKVLTHKYLGIPIFAAIMFGVFYLAFGPVGTFITEQFVWLIDQLFILIINGVDKLGMSPYISSLITKGVFGGLAAVVGFLPQLMILFLALAILEDSGYMSRAAFIMDRALRKFGLSGKSFIPMLIGFGCSVPAITATRTLDKDEDRKITAMIIPFVSCGAKAPIYGVFAGALFSNGSYIVVFSMYIIGLLVAILSAILFKKTIFKSASANYIMELPQYRRPTIKNTWLHTWERSKDFLIKAGTILLASFIIIWFLSYFGIVGGRLTLLSDEDISKSFLGHIGKFILPIFRPIGFNDWRSTVAILSGFVAKESVVGTLGILYGVSGDVVENGSALYPSIRAAFTPLQAYSFMLFALLAIPCIAAVSALKRELNSNKWFFFTLAYEMVVAYLIAMAVFQIGSLDLGTILTIIFTTIIIIFVYFMIRKFIRQKGSACATCDKSGNCSLPQNIEYLEKKGENKDEN